MRSEQDENHPGGFVHRLKRFADKGTRAWIWSGPAHRVAGGRRANEKIARENRASLVRHSNRDDPGKCQQNALPSIGLCA